MNFVFKVLHKEYKAKKNARVSQAISRIKYLSKNISFVNWTSRVLFPNKIFHVSISNTQIACLFEFIISISESHRPITSTLIRTMKKSSVVNGNLVTFAVPTFHLSLRQKVINLWYTYWTSLVAKLLNASSAIVPLARCPCTISTAIPIIWLNVRECGLSAMIAR